MSLERKETVDFITRLKDELFDPDLNNRYGTSLSINMGGKYSELIEKEYIRLTSEFEKINKDGNSYIDRDELRYFIQQNQKNNFKVTQAYCDKLFSLLDRDDDDQITMF